MSAALPATSRDILSRICADTLAEVARRKQDLSQAVLEQRIATSDDKPRGFGAALTQAAADGLGLVAEIKKASPSGGLIRPDFDPVALARAYRDGGATCLSVLTDGPHFQGDPADLRAARDAVDLPVLRKDFILDPWQVYESRAMGADCILLILAALTDEQAIELENTARALDMDVLAEAHDAAQLERAIGLQTKLIGINNRNLKTLRTDVNNVVELCTRVSPDRFLIAESGIATPEHVQQLVVNGIRAFLVGESLLRQNDVAAATRRLLGTTR